MSGIVSIVLIDLGGFFLINGGTRGGGVLSLLFLLVLLGALGWALSRPTRHEADKN